MLTKKIECIESSSKSETFSSKFTTPYNMAEIVVKCWGNFWRGGGGWANKNFPNGFILGNPDIFQKSKNDISWCTIAINHSRKILDPFFEEKKHLSYY